MNRPCSNSRSSACWPIPRSDAAGHQLCRPVAEPARFAEPDSHRRSVPRFRRQPAPGPAHAKPRCSSIAWCTRIVSVIDLLDADYTFVNERLAKHYGIPNVYGSRFRRVTLGPEFDMRRGLLGKGSILAVSSQPDRTSPVQRGKTVMQIFLGVSPPNPPPNVRRSSQAGSDRARRRQAHHAPADGIAPQGANRAPAATRSWTRSASRSRISTRSAAGD